MQVFKAKFKLVGVILAFNGLSLLLFGLRVAITQNSLYYFLFWNLLLAWLPLGFVWLLINSLKKKSWREPLPVLWSLLALTFLPNSFYIISDLIHLQDTGEVGIIYDAVLFMSIILNGMIAGFMSIYFVHKQLLKRLAASTAHRIVAGIFLLNGFAIYLGRSLRWNTWDILVHPFGVLYDVTERLINPLAHPQAFGTTLSFTLLLGGTYMVIWQIINVLTIKK